MLDKRANPKYVYMVILASMCYAYFNRFIQDDAFISLQYAKNLSSGLGPVWYAGERVEGYTNFLWVVLLSIPHAFGVDAVSFTYGLSLALFGVSQLLLMFVAKSFGLSVMGQLIFLMLVGSNYTFSAYATGGLETPLVVCLYYGLLTLVLRHSQQRYEKSYMVVVLAVMAAALAMTRLDSGVLCLPLFTVYFYQLYQKRAYRWRQALVVLGIFSLCLGLVLGPWVIWKWRYYGDFLPNTYYLKMGSKTSVEFGVSYLLEFFTSYWLVVILPFLWQRVRAMSYGPLLQWRSLPLLTLAIWFVYILRTGGDFMEFRFMVPVIPLLFLEFALALDSYAANQRFKLAAVVFLVAGSLYHRLNFDVFKGHDGLRIESVENLREHMYGDQSWIGVGETLAELFPEKDLKIAVTAAGAVAYYSGLATLDMLGLNDRHVARNGEFIGARPGHQRLASTRYLVEAGVNLLIGHPVFFEKSEFRFLPNPTTLPQVNFMWWFDISGEASYRYPLLCIPLDKNRCLFTLYLNRHRKIDQMLMAKKILMKNVDWTPANAKYSLASP